MSKLISKHIPVLDGIRAYAVLMVCLVHFFQVDENALYETHKYLGIFLFKISQIGLRGVELFFILSGFLITGILLDSKNSKTYFKSFYARRFLRIFPLYYFVLAVSFILLPQIIDVDEPGKLVINNQAWLWTYNSNLSYYFGFSGWDVSTNFPSFGHFWSLSVEEHFYIFWPLIIYFTKEKWISKVLIGITLVSLIIVLFDYFSEGLIPILRWTTFRGAGALSIGGLIAWNKRNSFNWLRLTKFAKQIIIPGGILFLASNFIPRKFGLLDTASFVTSIVFFTLLIITAINDNKITNKLFNHKWLYFIGKISYGIYVYHGLLRPYFKQYIYEGMLAHMNNGIFATIIYTIICTTVSIIISWLSWIIIEKPVIQLKKYFNY
jgi:peptidoglycan/LPS O-acetylase OafA/YrhL